MITGDLLRSSHDKNKMKNLIFKGFDIIFMMFHSELFKVISLVFKQEFYIVLRILLKFYTIFRTLSKLVGGTIT